MSSHIIFPGNRQYNHSDIKEPAPAGQSLAKGDSKDSHVPTAVSILFTNPVPKLHFPAEVRVFGPLPLPAGSSDEPLFLLPDSNVRYLISRGEVMPLYTKKRIRGVRLYPICPGCEKPLGPLHEPMPCVVGPSKPAAIRKPGLAAPHKRETRTNPEGCWTFDRLPRWCRDVFRAVVESCKEAA